MVCPAEHVVHLRWGQPTIPEAYKTEIGEHARAVLVYEDVLRLDVSVKNPAGV